MKSPAKISPFWVTIVGIFVVWAASELWIGVAVLGVYKSDVVGFEFSHSKLNLFRTATLYDGPDETQFDFYGTFTLADEYYRDAEEFDQLFTRPKFDLFPAPKISFSGAHQGFVIPYWLILAVMFVVRFVLCMIRKSEADDPRP